MEDIVDFSRLSHSTDVGFETPELTKMREAAAEREREREGERERERDRDRDRDRDRERNRQIQRERQSERERERDRQTETERQRERHTHRGEVVSTNRNDFFKSPPSFLSLERKVKGSSPCYISCDESSSVGTEVAVLRDEA